MTNNERVQQIFETLCVWVGKPAWEPMARAIIVMALEEAVLDAKNNQKFDLYELHKPDGTIEKWSGDFERRIKEEAYSKGYVQGHIEGEHYQEEKWTRRGVLEGLEIAAYIADSYTRFNKQFPNAEKNPAAVAAGIRNKLKELKTK